MSNQSSSGSTNQHPAGPNATPPSLFVPHYGPQPHLAFDVEVQGISPLLMNTQIQFLNDVNTSTNTIAVGRVERSRIVLRYCSSQEAWDTMNFLNQNKWGGHKLTALYKVNLSTSTVGSAGSQAWVKVEPP